MPPQSPMTESRDQGRPLAPASHRIHVENDDGDINAMELAKKQRRRRCIGCFSCCGATIIILAVIIIILFFTVFKVKDPTIRMNSIEFSGLSSLTSISNLQTNVNVTVFAQLSIKNPNAASFKFNSATTSLIYEGRVVGEALTPPGNARARRTLQMNVQVEMMVERLVGIPRLGGDLLNRELPVATFTRMNGRVKILGVIKKSVGIRMNCTMIVDLQRQDVRDLDCKRKVSL